MSSALASAPSWTFLSDPGRKVQKDLDIAEYTDPDHNPMIPHTLVLEPGLRVYKIYNGYWFFGRPTVEELRLDLRAVLQRCRPDWDISSAEQRTAWANGEKARVLPVRKNAGAGVRRTGLISIENVAMRYPVRIRNRVKRTEARGLCRRTPHASRPLKK